jgi:signal transduction histidine kinase
LHDVVAHHISAIAIQAETARLTTVGLSDDCARRFVAIGSSARAALDEMRRLLGVMRAPLDVAEQAPQPGLGQLAALVDQQRDHGSDVRLTVNGRVRPLPAAVELVAYRVVQEALTNAGRHAAGAAIDVTLTYAADELRVRVSDDGPGARSTTGGFGLIGMRERVDAVGGSLAVGNRDASGFEITATLPTQ